MALALATIPVTDPDAIVRFNANATAISAWESMPDGETTGWFGRVWSAILDAGGKTWAGLRAMADAALDAPAILITQSGEVIRTTISAVTSTISGLAWSGVFALILVIGAVIYLAPHVGPTVAAIKS